ncbi:hypothetical protein Tsp_00917 [Trichinella spiralis]|uniref:hypothetical protein n=1 Tax=Trichinella spiralis TaxID=6334 RepID=UPI0001EFB6C1|nr:hypothetical protein Tsp_00917 [Trichinella spiralis]
MHKQKLLLKKRKIEQLTTIERDPNVDKFTADCTDWTQRNESKGVVTRRERSQAARHHRPNNNCLINDQIDGLNFLAKPTRLNRSRIPAGLAERKSGRRRKSNHLVNNQIPRLRGERVRTCPARIPTCLLEKHFRLPNQTSQSQAQINLLYCEIS